MKSYRAKTFLKLIAIISCAALVSCAADAAPDETTINLPDHDATHSQEDTQADDASTPQEDASDADSQDASLPDASAPDVEADADAESQTDADPGDVEEADAQPDSTDEDTTPPVADGKTCETAIDITDGGLWDNQTTAGAGDNYNAPIGAENCPAATSTGSDEVFVLAPETTTTYKLTITSQDSAFRPVVYIRDDCTQSACIEGSQLNDTVLTFNNLEVPGGEPYYVIVDTHILSSDGAYSINVEIQ